MAYYPYCATYDIKEELAVITRYNNGGRKEINLVSWNGGAPKLDIRYWEAGHSVVGKGTTLDKAEALAAYKALQEWLANPLTVRGILAVNGSGFCILKKFGEIYRGIGGWTKQINIVSWCGKMPVFDIRYWAQNNAKAGRGLTLDGNEALVVYQVLKELLGPVNNTVVNKLEKEAAAGDRSAMRKLGDMYRDGYLVGQNYETAYEWYKRDALAGGDAVDLLNLAFSVEYWRTDGGLKVETKDKMMAECYRLAADLGDATGMRYLAACYLSGSGVEQDVDKAYEYYGEAVKRYEKEIASGSVYAMYDLGTMYHNGEGVKEDVGKAFSLYEKAIFNSEDHDLNSAIFEIYSEEANDGNTRALGKFGDMYYFGWGTETDYEEAIRWYEAAGKAGQNSFYKIGNMYRSGPEVAKDYKKAMEWYEKGVDKGEVRSMLALADMYFLGLGVEKDYKKYLEWHNKATQRELEIAKKRCLKK